MDVNSLEVCLVPFTTVVALESCAIDLGGVALEDHVCSHRIELLGIASSDRVRPLTRYHWHAASQGGRLVDLLMGTLSHLLQPLSGGPGLARGVGSEVWMRFRSRFDPTLGLCLFAAMKGVEAKKLTARHLSLSQGDREFMAVMSHGEGLAETHMHMNAALTSECVWCLLVAGDRTEAPSDPPFAAPNVAKGGPSSVSMAPWLYVGMVTRLLLIAYLGQTGETRGFGAFALRAIQDVITGPCSLLFSAGIDEAWRCALRAENGREAVRRFPEAQWQRLHEELRANLQATDPAGAREAPGIRDLVNAERKLVMRVLSQILASRGGGVSCLDLEGAFLQYVRVRNLFHRYLVHSGSGTGLYDFARHFGDASRYIKLFHRRRDEALGFAMEQLDPEGQIKLCELRVSPRVDDPDDPEVKDRLRTMPEIEGMLLMLQKLEEPGSPPRRRAGLVFHFLKKASTPRLLPSTERECRHDWRHGPRFAALVEEAAALSNLWSSIIEVSPWLCGFDVAGLEEESPNWIYAAVLRKLRENLEAEAFDQGIDPPKLTVHAGEVFSHIVAGLHRVHEAAELLSPGTGGRIGHGLVLASCFESQGDQLIGNEAWGRALLWACEVSRMAGHHSRHLERELEMWMAHLNGQVVYGSALAHRFPGLCPLSPSLVASTYEALASPGQLKVIGYPFLATREECDRGDPRPEEGIQALLRFFLSDDRYAVWAEQDRLRPDPPDEDLGVLRRIVVARLARDGIAVEACPSSNMAIGGVPSCTEHPVTSEFSAGGQYRLRCSLNTDDPVHFATDLRTEYWVMYEAMAAKRGRAAAGEWLGHRRDDGLRTSFLDGDRGASNDWGRLWSVWENRVEDRDLVRGIEAPDAKAFWTR